MNNCSNLFVLSAIACKLSECLSENELGMLAANLNTLGDMLEGIIASTAANQSQLTKIQKNTCKN